MRLILCHARLGMRSWLPACTETAHQTALTCFVLVLMLDTVVLCLPAGQLLQ